ncbi:serine-type endopeptidase [Aureococcus anophagefferens]|nr:serine-type endopeptidase [Aureococcus anophagefferens]
MLTRALHANALALSRALRFPREKADSLESAARPWTAAHREELRSPANKQPLASPSAAKAKRPAADPAWTGGPRPPRSSELGKSKAFNANPQATVPTVAPNMMKISLLALALTTVSAARRRRLAEQLDLPKLAEDADEGLLGSRVLFQLESSVDASSVAAKVSSILDCGSSPERIFRSAGKFEAAHKQAGLDRWYQVECGGSSDDKTAASKEMFAHLMQYLDSDDHDGDHYDAIRLFEAWDVTKGSADVVVQVLDTGIDMSHPDLKMNIWRNEGEICGNGVDDDNNGYVDDCHGYNHADDTGTDLSIKDAIDYYNAKNGIVVFAAGNQNSASDYYPAYYDGTIAVAAVTDAGVRASFSNYGDWIEISAPGVSVYSTQLGTAYGYASGTSMACPHVAGCVEIKSSTRLQCARIRMF